jgi:AraC-like DNA-binding protein
MTSNEHDEKRHSLDDEQKVDARQALGCGLSVQQVAQHFGLSESELRSELGMPQWRSEPHADRQQTLFDDGGAA